MAGEAKLHEDVVSELRRRYDELTHSQKRIAEAVVEDPEFIAFATVDEVATKLGVSPSTVVRFAYRLGLDGYPDLQDRVRSIVRTRLHRGSSAASDDAALAGHLDDSVFARSLTHDLSNLRQTIEALKVADLQRAVEMLDRAERLFVFGGLGSYSVAYFTGLVLDRLRGSSYVLDGNDALSATRLADASERDALVVFTFAPYVQSALRLVRFAKRRTLAIIAVTDTPISPVGQLVDVVLPAVASGVSTNNSLVGAMAVSNALINGLVVARSGRALERYRGVTKLLDEWDEMILKGEG